MKLPSLDTHADILQLAHTGSRPFSVNPVTQVRSPIGVGIIGCGAIGTEHARALSQLEEASLRAFCDVDPERASGLLPLAPDAYTTDSPERLFADPDIDALYICTRTDTHTPLGIAAARAGKQIMMEKPLALTEQECYAIAEEVERNGVALMTAFKMRFTGAVQRAHAFIPHPTLVVGQMTDLHWPEGFWGNDPAEGGGNVLSQGCHSVDLLTYLAGSEPVRIYAEGGNFHHPRNPIVDTLTATIHFANGSVGSLVQADSGHTPLLSKLSFQLLDGTRTAHIHDRLKSVTFWDGKVESKYADATENGLFEENRAFLRALISGTPTPTSVRDGIRATVVLLRALDSLAHHRPETITL